MRRGGLVVLSLMAPCTALGQQVRFTEVASEAGLATPWRKQGGVAWADFDTDGCLDVAVVTAEDSPDGGGNGRLYRNDCKAPPAFEDVTASHASGLRLVGDRSVLWGDLDNDGYVDLLRNEAFSISLFLNGGPGASPPYRLGAGPMHLYGLSEDPNLNVEGVGLLDFGGDGWLDVIYQSNGLRLLQSQAPDAGTFKLITRNGQTQGLPYAEDAGTYPGNYLAVADYDVDGDMDVLVRHEAPYGLFRQEEGFFAAESSFTERSFDQTLADKGGSAFCDLDDDGDFDIVWPGAAELLSNGVWLQQAGGRFEKHTAFPNPPGNARSVACGDVDHDGDLDVFVTASGQDVLYLNHGLVAGKLTFAALPDVVFARFESYGVTFVDYDRDGDLDVYINQTDRNELWRNELEAKDYLMLRALRPVSSGARDDLGATAWLEDCEGLRLSGVREVSGGTGMGSQPPPLVHFGLPQGSDLPYVVRVKFVGGRVVKKAVLPSALDGYRVLSVRMDEADDVSACKRGSGTSDGGSATGADGGDPSRADGGGADVWGGVGLGSGCNCGQVPGGLFGLLGLVTLLRLRQRSSRSTDSSPSSG